MNKVEKVSIGGYAFTLDVDAAAAANSYIKEIELYYANPEITDGIEERMAELLNERVAPGGVISKATIDSVIAILGRPERIAEDQPEEPSDVKAPRKLYRDMDHARVAGVCSGLGAYFKFDPIILRIVFAALTIAGLFAAEASTVLLFGAPLAYLILWICIPAARTAQQRWALRGEDGTAEGVRRSIENGAGDVGDALRQVGNSPAWSGVGRILEVIMGLLLIIISVSGLFAGALAVFGWQWLGLGNVLTDAMVEILEEFPQAAVIANTTWVGILAALVYTLPFVGMLYGGILMVFHLKSPSWHPGIIIFVLWLLALVALIILGVGCAISASAISV